MIIPGDIVGPAISLSDGYFDLRGLSAYSSLKVPTIRNYIKSGDLPAFKLKGKLLIKKSEFDQWIESYRLNKKQKLAGIVDGVLGSLKTRQSN